jgi:formate dehydrogenase subunit delta
VDAGRLIKMANDIGQFFAIDAEHDPARAHLGIADHIKRFWDPRMRRQILALVDSTDEQYEVVLDALVAAAIKEHQTLLTPK